MESQDKLKAEESFPISENDYTLGRLLDGTKCQLLLDTGTSKSFMSKPFYMQYTNCLQSKKYCEAIMDDLILFTLSKESHVSKLEDLLKALLKNGLKVSPKKCQLFKTSPQYMGNEIFIENKKVCVKPLRSRLEAIQKYTTT